MRKQGLLPDKKMETVQIKNAFFGEWEDLNLALSPITDLEQAIKIVRASGIKNIELKHGNKEWDNL